MQGSPGRPRADGDSPRPAVTRALLIAVLCACGGAAPDDCYLEGPLVPHCVSTTGGQACTNCPTYPLCPESNHDGHGCWVDGQLKQCMDTCPGSGNPSCGNVCG